MSVAEEVAELGSAPLPSGVGRGAQVGYGVGQIAGQVFRDVPSLLLLFFMTNALGVRPALAGIAIFVPKLVWGIVCDVGVGVLSDRFRARLPRRWWLLMGAAGAPFAMILLFHVPAGTETVKVLYVAGAFSLYMAVFAVLSVPYLAIAGEMSNDPGQRTVIMAWRLVFTAIGVLIAGSFAPIFLQSRGGGQPAYEALSIILAVVCPLSLVVAFLAAGRAPASTTAAPVSLGFPVREALAALAAPRFSVLLGANLMQLVASGMAYASMIYFLTYNLSRPDAFKQIGIIVLIASGSIIAAQPLWVRIANWLGKGRTFVAGSLLYGATMGAWGLSAHFGATGIAISYAFAVMLGLSNSGWSLMGFSMVSDLSEDGRGGLYSSIWVAADKIGFALGGTLLVGLILQMFGFDAGRAMAGLTQPPKAVGGVLMCYSLVPAALSAAAATTLALWGDRAQRLPPAVAGAPSVSR